MAGSRPPVPLLQRTRLLFPLMSIRVVASTVTVFSFPPIITALHCPVSRTLLEFPLTTTAPPAQSSVTFCPLSEIARCAETPTGAANTSAITIEPRMRFLLPRRHPIARHGLEKHQGRHDHGSLK